MTGQFPLGQSRQWVRCVLVTLHPHGSVPRHLLTHILCPSLPSHHATQTHGAAGCQIKAMVISQAFFLCPSLESPRTLLLLSDSSHGKSQCPLAAL